MAVLKNDKYLIQPKWQAGLFLACFILAGCFMPFQTHRKQQENPSVIETRMKEKIHKGQDLETLTSYLKSEEGVRFHYSTSDETVYFDRRFEPVGFIIFSISTTICGEIQIHQGHVASLRIRQLHTGP